MSQLEPQFGGLNVGDPNVGDLYVVDPYLPRVRKQ